MFNRLFLQVSIKTRMAKHGTAGESLCNKIEIRVKGQIDEHWSNWFEGMTITHTEQGETVLTGTVVDEPAMYGLLAKIRDLGLQLISVNSNRQDL